MQLWIIAIAAAIALTSGAWHAPSACAAGCPSSDAEYKALEHKVLDRSQPYCKQGDGSTAEAACRQWCVDENTGHYDVDTGAMLPDFDREMIQVCQRFCVEQDMEHGKMGQQELRSHALLRNIMFGSWCMFGCVNDELRSELVLKGC